MSWTPESEAPPSLHERQAKALLPPPGAPPEQTQATRRGFFAVCREIWNAVRGYTADDIDRLKEGGVQQVEGKGQREIAEAQAKLAEADERHANAERAKAEAEKLKAEAQRTKAEAYAIRKKADSESVKDQAAALESVVEAISRIKQQGGNVAFDMETIQRLLQQGKEEFPDDSQIAGDDD